MLYRYPDYYDRFACIADRCEETCCAGWQIVIDEDALEKYREKLSGKKDDRIDWEEGVFCQSGEKRCTFLNDRNLCDMYIEWGEEYLCETCRRYPRHIEEFENIREYTLSLSCPEAAQIILGNREKVTFIEKEDELEEEDEEFDDLLFSMLADVREVLYEILQNRKLGIRQRILLLLDVTEKCQEKIDEDDIFAINDVIEKYSHDEKKEPVLEDASNYEKSLARFQMLFQMELLNDLWADMTDEAAELVYGGGESVYRKEHHEFETWLAVHYKDYDIILEQILVYFISTYFCGAVYDGDMTGKTQIAVTSLVCINEMLFARWKKNGKELDFSDIVTIAYMYSRELEHSDVNLELFSGAE